VEIVEFRPFFVMGDVQKPGTYPYRPGLNVLQAVSIAGGYYRPTDTMFRLERDAIESRGAILLHARQGRQFAARIARLEAEKQDAPTITFPAEFDPSPGSPDFVLMSEEQAIFKANREALEKTKETLDRYLTLYQQEIESIRGQIASEKKQFAAVQKELDNLNKLADKGLTSLPRQLSTERTAAQIQSTIHALEATVLRAQQNISQTEQRQIDVMNNRTDRINNDLQKARADARETDFKLKTARDLLMEAEVIAPSLYAANQGGTRDPKFTVSRSAGGATEEITVDRVSDVLPGDVLTVERRAPIAGQNGRTAASGASQ
jgi:chromosome segregation ATPase